MGRYTCAYNCGSSGDSDVKFFKFPLYNPKKLKKWLVNMNMKDWTPTRFSALCIKHFEEQHIDRTTKCVKLKEDAVPTLFTPAGDTQKRKASTNPRSNRTKRAGVKALQTQSSATTTVTPKNKETSQNQKKEPSGDKAPKSSDRWRIIIDEGLMKINSFPHFFHGDYCVPQDVQWAPDDDINTECEDPEKVIEVNEAWQWLGLDVRGPLPVTHSGHKYVLTVTDYYSKWVEALPMATCLPSSVAKNVADIIAHFGFPLRILSRLPLDIVHKTNKELKDRLKVDVALLVYHQQTGAVDLVTQQMIDRMVGDLAEEHAADWDVYLPAQVFSLCFREHPKTKERPFSLLCCNGPEPVQSPRDANIDYTKIRENAFVVR